MNLLCGVQVDYWYGDEVAWILGFEVCVKIWDTM